MDTSTYVTKIIGTRYDFLMNVLVYSNYSHVIIIRIWHQLCRALDHEWIHPWREVIVGLKLSQILLQRRHHPTILPLPLNSKYNNLCIFLLFLHCICIRQRSFTTHWEYIRMRYISYITNFKLCFWHYSD